MASQVPDAAGRSVLEPLPSPRVRLGRLVLDTALALDGVAAGHAGPAGTCVTEGGGARSVGVVAVANAAGSFDLGLHLTATYPAALYPLADEIRRRGAAAAGSQGMTDLLGSIDVTFEDVAELDSSGQPVRSRP